MSVMSGVICGSCHVSCSPVMMSNSARRYSRTVMPDAQPFQNGLVEALGYDVIGNYRYPLSEAVPARREVVLADTTRIQARVYPVIAVCGALCPDPETPIHRGVYLHFLSSKNCQLERLA